MGPSDDATELVLLSVWVLIGLGSAARDGSYSTSLVVVMTVGVILLLLVSARRFLPTTSGDTVRRGGQAAACAALFAAIALPAGIYGSGPDLDVSRVLNAVAALLVAVWLICGFPRGRLLAYVAVGVMTMAGLFMVLSSPRPAIDVWYMLQAAGHGLSHGHNIYAVRWTSGVPGGVSNTFTYLPGSAVLLWPFHALFGDVRYGLLAAMALTTFVLIRISRGSVAALIACLFPLYPRFLFGLEQSWVDPLSLLFLCLTGYAMIRGRRGWAVVAFAVVLSCKQYNWLLIPFAVLWVDFGWRRTALSVAGASAFVSPWIVADTHAFIAGAFRYNFDIPPGWIRSRCTRRPSCTGTIRGCG